jgi:short subunit dehydrogenase-like uncharacterized protein
VRCERVVDLQGHIGRPGFAESSGFLPGAAPPFSPVVSKVSRVYPEWMQISVDNSKRQFDVVVWGATGFTGRLVVEYLARQYPAGGPLKWAAAARDQEKLRRVLADVSPAADQIPTMIADSGDAVSLSVLVKSTKVVLTTVGPYAKYGNELVKACVEAGTHYCDLAGEVQWMRSMIDQHQEEAQSSGAKIVHSCGFDSIPSDIGVFLLQKAAIEQFGAPCNRIKLLVKAMKGGASGGTIASMLNAIEHAREDPAIARILTEPYALNPEGRRKGPDGRDQEKIEFDEDAGVWTGPFVMAAINTRIVRRTNALLDYRYGEQFRYRESTITGKGVSGWFKSAIMTLGLGAFMLASSFKFTRDKVVRRLVPKPGEGPNAEQRKNGFFNLKLIGKTKSGQTLRMTVKGDRDPGYGSTSKMLAESAICLATDDLTVKGGFWTPAAAMG